MNVYEKALQRLVDAANGVDHMALPAMCVEGDMPEDSLAAYDEWEAALTEAQDLLSKPTE